MSVTMRVARVDLPMQFFVHDICCSRASEVLHLRSNSVFIIPNSDLRHTFAQTDVNDENTQHATMTSTDEQEDEDAMDSGL